jgi:hypothetical protein
MAESTKVSGFQLIQDLGDGLKLYMADLSALREQDVNARMMPTKEYGQLVNNIRQRGGMESVPYCVVPEDSSAVEVVSGHHRIRAAREAGVKQAPVIIDESGLNRSQIISKQLSHNRLVGFDDQETLQKLFNMMVTPEDVLASGLADDLLHVPEVSLDPLLAPHMDLNWKAVSFAFLPHQLDNLNKLVDDIPASDMVAVGDIDQFDNFMKAVIGYARLKNIRNAGIAIAVLTDIALKQLEADADETGTGTVDDEGVPGEAVPAPSSQF